MKLTTTGRQAIDEGHKFGVYVWRCEDGEVAGDGEGNIMSAYSFRNNPEAVKSITQAARHYGAGPGKVEFWPGKRPITDEEYEEQIDRHKSGLIADPYDIGAIMDQLRAQKQND